MNSTVPTTSARARFLLPLLLTALLPVWASTVRAQTPICDAVSRLDPPAEIAASPRDNYNAELLALAGSGGVAADAVMYEQILRDFSAIEALEPGVTEWPLQPEETTDGFFLWFDTEADRDRAENGEIEDYDCLNELLDLKSATYYNFVLPRTVFLEFGGVYNLPRLRELYEQIPTADFTGPNGGSVPDIGCYYSPDGLSRVYFLEQWEFGLPFMVVITDWVRVEVGFGGAAVERVEGPDPPPWIDERSACIAGEFSGELDFLGAPVTDIPTV
ncbi:MAG: hypothetical protein AAFY88_24910, partial [Acidobacteriota bacterium]